MDVCLDVSWIRRDCAQRSAHSVGATRGNHLWRTPFQSYLWSLRLHFSIKEQRPIISSENQTISTLSGAISVSLLPKITYNDAKNPCATLCPNFPCGSEMQARQGKRDTPYMSWTICHAGCCLPVYWGKIGKWYSIWPPLTAYALQRWELWDYDIPLWLASDHFGYIICSRFLPEKAALSNCLQDIICAHFNGIWQTFPIR